MNNNNNNISGDILPINKWLNRFLNLGNIRRDGKSLFDTENLFGDFDDMHKEMNRTVQCVQ